MNMSWGADLDGTLIAWGDERYGGKLPAEYEYSSNPIKGVVANEKAFAAWRQDGSVMVWETSYMAEALMQVATKILLSHLKQV